MTEWVETGLVLSMAVAVWGCVGPARSARLTQPRVLPLEKGEWTDEQRSYLEPHERAGRLMNVFKTAGRHPAMGRSLDALAFGHVNNSESTTLSVRDRELLILRVSWVCRCEYVWAVHSRAARAAGVSVAALRAVADRPDGEGLSGFETALLSAVDELCGDAFVTDETWDALSEAYSTQQMMDVVLTVGTYNMACMMANSLGIQLDEGLGEFGFPG